MKNRTNTTWQLLLVVLWLFLLFDFNVRSSSSSCDAVRLRDILNSKVDDDSSSSSFYGDDDDVEENYLTQNLDHFSSFHQKRRRTFQQRYFSSRQFVLSSNNTTTTTKAYAFLCVGGEGPGLTKRVLVDSVHCTGDMIELARQLSSSSSSETSVYLFALEHRYYGHSYPSQNSLELSNLLFLSSKQAVEDIASFVRHIQQQEEESIPANVKWVTFGGSYPGFLSAMARQLHPELITAAVSSSAPVRFVINFQRYKEHQGWDLRYPRIGGSDECLRIVREGHDQIAKELLLEDDDVDYNKIGTMFGLCNDTLPQLVTNRYNLGLFLGDGVVDIPAQGNDPSCNNTEVCNLQRVCDFLTTQQPANRSSMERLGALARKQQQGDNNCMRIDWNQTLVELSNATINPDGDNWRSWLWQTCTEFGYYQTCPAESDCPFGRGYHTIDMDYNLCHVVFSLNARKVVNNIQATTTYYHYHHASRILSVNGNVDPWSELAVLPNTTTTQPNSLLPAYVVKGASHHFWTHPTKETDDVEIQMARTLIYDTVTKWLQEDTGAVATAAVA